MTAALILKHNYPYDSPTATVASVEISHLLESVKGSDLEKGAWVNLVGYKTLLTRPQPNNSECQVCVQAVMLWSAGAVKLHAYETALSLRLRSGR